MPECGYLLKVQQAIHGSITNDGPLRLRTWLQAKLERRRIRALEHPIRLALFPAPLTHQFHDICRRSACHEAADIVEMNPATPANFVAGASLGASRDFAEEHMMMLLSATKIEEMTH